MLIPPSILLLLLLFFNAQMSASSSNHSFHVDLSQLLDPSLRAGVLKSIEEIHGRSCLQFSIQKDDGFPQANVGPHRIRFVQSTPGGPCGLDSSFSTLRAKNATIYLNGKCAPANETETISLRLLGLALTGQKTATNSVLPQINAHFNCPDNCPQLCQNGGHLSADGDCTCQCPFNGLFDGENCEELVKLGEYTDSACGPVSVENGEGGILKLSGRMDSNTYCQFLLRSQDPWARFRVDFLGLEMSRKAAGTIDCPDKLQVYGLASTPMFSVKCSAAESPKPGHTFVSASNFLLFQLEANRFDSAPRQGPIIHYVLERPEYSEEIRLLHPSDAHKSGGNSGNANGHNGMHIDPSSHLPLAALLFVVAGVSVIVLILLALRRHSANRVKRRTNANGGHHTPVPSSPTPPPANGNGGC